MDVAEERELTVLREENARLRLLLKDVLDAVKSGFMTGALVVRIRKELRKM